MPLQTAMLLLEQHVKLNALNTLTLISFRFPFSPIFTYALVFGILRNSIQDKFYKQQPPVTIIKHHSIMALATLKIFIYLAQAFTLKCAFKHIVDCLKNIQHDCLVFLWNVYHPRYNVSGVFSSTNSMDVDSYYGYSWNCFSDLSSGRSSSTTSSPDFNVHRKYSLDQVPKLQHCVSMS